MKKILFSIITPFVMTLFSMGQPSFTLGFINFDDGQYLNFLHIDTSLPANIWQIGKPQKSFFNAAYSTPNAILTDTTSPYPINNLSSFYLYVPYDPMSLGQILSFNYKIFSDTLSDLGTVEFSLDKGLIWYNLITDASSFGIYWRIILADPPWTTLYDSHDSIYPFSGKSPVWYAFDMPWWDSWPINVDTVYYRFSFQSDGIQTNKDGWMIDDILFGNIFEGINDHEINNIITIIPNPILNDFTITLSDQICNNPKELLTCEIFSVQGKKIIDKKFFGKSIKIKDLESSIPGIYLLKIRKEMKTIMCKKIIKIR